MFDYNQLHEKHERVKHSASPDCTSDQCTRVQELCLECYAIPPTVYFTPFCVEIMAQSFKTS